MASGTTAYLPDTRNERTIYSGEMPKLALRHTSPTNQPCPKNVFRCRSPPHDVQKTSVCRLCGRPQLASRTPYTSKIDPVVPHHRQHNRHQADAYPPRFSRSSCRYSLPSPADSPSFATATKPTSPVHVQASHRRPPTRWTHEARLRRPQVDIRSTTSTAVRQPFQQAWPRSSRRPRHRPPTRPGGEPLAVHRRPRNADRRIAAIQIPLTTC